MHQFLTAKNEDLVIVLCPVFLNIKDKQISEIKVLTKAALERAVNLKTIKWADPNSMLCYVKHN